MDSWAQIDNDDDDNIFFAAGCGRVPESTGVKPGSALSPQGIFSQKGRFNWHFDKPPMTTPGGCLA